MGSPCRQTPCPMHQPGCVITHVRAPTTPANTPHLEHRSLGLQHGRLAIKPRNRALCNLCVCQAGLQRAIEVAHHQAAGILHRGNGVHKHTQRLGACHVHQCLHVYVSQVVNSGAQGGMLGLPHSLQQALSTVELPHENHNLSCVYSAAAKGVAP